MSWTTIIIFMVVLFLLAKLAGKLIMTFLLPVYMLLTSAFRFLYTPFHKLFAFLKEKALTLVPERLQNPYPSKIRSVLGGWSSLVLFAAAAAFVAISYLSVDPFRKLEYITELGKNTVVGSFINLFISGFDFSASVLISAAFSGFLASLLMHRTQKANIVIWAIYSVAFIAAAAVFSSMLSGVFDSVGAWAVNTWNWSRGMFSAQGFNFLGIIKAIFFLALLAVIAYLAVLLIITAVREYMSIVCFGMMCLAVVLVVFVLIQKLFPVPVDFVGFHWTAIVLLILFLVAIIATELIRLKVLDKLEEE